jgi:peptidyl-prolyl cis-trans isomerase B (cyclophilin B)
MQKIQSTFNQLAKEHHDEIMQMRRERNRAGLQELQDKLAAEAEAQVTGEGLTEEQRTIYSAIGGTPHLDGQYTVFGEVDEGLDVVEMIQQTATARGDRPVDDIEMRMILVD